MDFQTIDMSIFTFLIALYRTLLGLFGIVCQSKKIIWHLISWSKPYDLNPLTARSDQ